MVSRLLQRKTMMLLTSLLVGSFFSVSPSASAAQQAVAEKSPLPVTISSRSPIKGTQPYHSPAGLPASAKRFYQATWGVDIIGVKGLQSGSMLKFQYRVLDASKGATLNDKRATPYLIDERTKIKLEVPTMDKVGALRQSAPAEDGKVYWMVFDNMQKVVHPGSRVDVVIGKFHAEGIVVQ